MADSLLTVLDTIQTQLAAAQGRRRRAAAAEARLRREIVATDRRLGAQQKITLGAALLRLAASEPRHVEQLRRGIHRFITRDVDRACLRGTPFELPEATDVASPPTDVTPGS